MSVKRPKRVETDSQADESISGSDLTPKRRMNTEPAPLDFLSENESVSESSPIVTED